MRQSLPKKLFFAISKNLHSEDPTWALLVANEYLETNDPLRKAMVQKIRHRATSHPLFLAVCNGKRMSDLSEEEQTVIKQSRSALRSTTKVIPVPRSRAMMRPATFRDISVVNG